jgi:hypothetical protein
MDRRGFSKAGLLAVVGIYVLIFLTTFNWGIPNEERVFLYHMDEWHQLMAVRAVYRQGTPNVEGSAHGPMFHFLLSGLYLLPFIVVGWLKPGVVNSAVSGLEMQRRFFQVLRVETLLFGLGAMVLVWLVLKRWFKAKPFLGVLLFVLTPIWLVLSGHFKYDIALVFWIALALWLMLAYGREPSVKNYLLASGATALAVATKISAVPLIVVLVVTYFLYSRDCRRDLRTLFWGLALCFLVFVLVGIPDVLLGIVKMREYSEFFQSNLVTNPGLTVNYLLKMPWWLYLLVIQLPSQFGYGLWLLFLVSLVCWAGGVVRRGWVKKDEALVVWSLVVFGVSLMPLKLMAAGNRSLVLLPFMVILVVVIFARILVSGGRFWLRGLMVGLVALQVVEAVMAVRLKWQEDPRLVASAWIEERVPVGTRIGLENVPVYQMVPDILLKDYYWQQYGLEEGQYHYQIVDEDSEAWPEIVVVSDWMRTKFEQKSGKARLMKKLADKGYEERQRFDRGATLEEQLVDRLGLLRPRFMPVPGEISILVR